MRIIQWSKRLSCQLALAAIFGILLAEQASLRYLMLAAAILIYLLLPLLWQKNFTECVLRGALLFAVGALAAGCFLKQDAGWEREGQTLISGRQVCVRGTVVWKEQKSNCWQLTLSLPGYENQVIVSTEDGAYPLDCVLWVKGTIKDFDRPRNEGQFNESNYYKSKQIIGQMYAEETSCVYEQKGIFAWRERLYAVRERLCQVYGETLPAQEAGILSAMAAGDKSFLDAGTRLLFQRAGISHILAISGMHISLIGMGLYGLLRRCGLPYAFCMGLTSDLLFLYGTMIGMSVSAKRAIGMFFIYMLAQCIGRGYDALSALSVLALFLLIQNPFLLHNVSFQFSFAAVFAVVTIGDVFPSEEDSGRLARFARALGFGLLLQLFTLPLAAYYYYELPLYALFLNLLLLPYLGAALGFGLLGGGAGLLGGAVRFGVAAGIFRISLTRILLTPCHLVLSVYLWVCGLAVKLPYATVICGRPSAAKLWIYYGLLAVMFGILRARRESSARTEDERPDEKVPEAKAVSGSGGLSGNLRAGQSAGVVLLRGMSLLVSAAGLLFFLCYAPSGGFEIDFLDVGQGDGSMLRAANGSVCFVDGGSSDISGAGTYRILPFLKSKGIRRVDYWILSHLDEDHVSGFYEVLEAGYEVGTVVVAEALPEDEAREKLLAALEQQEIPLIRVRGGDVMQLHHTGGDKAADESASIRFLSPDSKTPFSDRNGASLVCLYEDAALRALWTGDIGEEQEAWLLASGALPEIDVYKAAHHGSSYSNSEKYLEALSPRISVISCAERNRYGHPGAQAVANMETAGSRIFYTMDSGQIKVQCGEEGLLVEEFLAGQ